MPPLNMRSIRWESIKAIFHAIAEAQAYSRAQISDATGLSLVTVGKVADVLLEMGILTEEKEVRQAAGRRAGLLHIHPDKFALILDLSSRELRFAILDLRLELIEKKVFSEMHAPSASGGTQSYAENLQLFLHETLSHLVEHYDLSDCFGIGVSLPGFYDATADRVLSTRIPEITGIAVRAQIEAVFPGFPLHLETSENAAALSNIVSVADSTNKTILYWYLSDTMTTGTLLVNGSFLHGHAQPCQFGRIRTEDGLLLGDKLRTCQTPETFVSTLVLPLYNILQILSPDTVILDCDLEKLPPETRSTIAPKLQEALLPLSGEGTLPDIRSTCCRLCHAHRGLAMHLRRMWLSQAMD